MVAKKFTNYTDRDFSWKWDGVEYTFRAGETMFLEDYKAHHFAKHLVDRELTKDGILTNNVLERAKRELLCFPDTEVVSTHEAMQEEEAKKEEVKADIKKKGRPRKVAEEEFSDL